MARNVIDVARNPHLLDPSSEWYGIEVEAEGFTVQQAMRHTWPDYFRSSWGYHEDGSLRNGIEFVSAPLKPAQAEDAIVGLWKCAIPKLAAGTGRTGIHIHASCLGLNTDQLLKMARCYALVEPVMFSIAGSFREENIFCIPWYRGDDEPARVYAVLSNDTAVAKHRTSFFVHRRPTTCKYSALNISPLINLGTVEFRHAPTYSSAENMLAWFRAVRCMYLSHVMPEDPLSLWREIGPVEFAARIFGRATAKNHANLRELEKYDVERTALLLYPKKPVVSREWGIPPMLKITPRKEPIVPAARTRFEDELLDEPSPPPQPRDERVTIEWTEPAEAVWTDEHTPIVPPRRRAIPPAVEQVTAQARRQTQVDMAEMLRRYQELRRDPGAEARSADLWASILNTPVTPRGTTGNDPAAS